MTAYSSILAWKIPWMEEPGRLQSMEFQRVWHDWTTSHSAKFVSKVIPLLFNMLSKFVIAFIPRNKQLLILWLQSPCVVILEPRKITPVTVSSSICHDLMGPDAIIIFFYCSGFCHTLKWISHGFTCVPHPDPPSHLPLQPLPLGFTSATGPSACLMHPTWAGDLFHPR